MAVLCLYLLCTLEDKKVCFVSLDIYHDDDTFTPRVCTGIGIGRELDPSRDWSSSNNVG